MRATFLLLVVSVGLILLQRHVDAQCDFIKSTPIANASHYQHLSYQSGQGKNCLKYQVKNSDKGLFMPVQWSYGTLTLLDVNVPAGATDWIAYCHTATQNDTGETHFSYGANKKQFTDKPDAYRRAGKPPGCNGTQPDDFRDLVTSIKGKIGLTAEKTAMIDLKLTSSYDKTKKNIKTKIEIGKECATLVFLTEKASYDGNEIRLNWDSIAHSIILDQTKGQPITLSGAEKRLSVESSVSVGQGVEPEVKSALLRLVSEKTVVGAVTAPAYNPGKTK
jgi:hypothetical protein